MKEVSQKKKKKTWGGLSKAYSLNQCMEEMKRQKSNKTNYNIDLIINTILNIWQKKKKKKPCAQGKIPDLCFWM